MEIYNETIKDLFNTDSGYLELRGNNNVQIIGLTELVVTSSQQVRFQENQYLIYLIC